MDVVKVVVNGTGDHLGVDTDYSYNLSVVAGNLSSPTVVISANSSFGALYGLETLWQLGSNPRTSGSTS